MMIKKIKYICCMLFFIFVIGGSVFATGVSTMHWYQSTNSSGYTEVKNSYIFRAVMGLNDVNVNFTQDDKNYYFEVTANSTVPIHNVMDCFESLIRYKPSPVLYKKEQFGNTMVLSEGVKRPYASNNSGTFFTNSSVTIGGVGLSSYSFRYKRSGDKTAVEENYSYSNGERYYLPATLRDRVSGNNEILRYAGTYPIECYNNGEGVSILKNNSSSYLSYIGSDVDTYYAYMDVKIGINKSYIDDYRYLCFAESLITVSLRSTSNLQGTYEGTSFCTGTIDLKEYTNCDHNFVYEITDKNGHKAVCDKCKWEKVEPHELLYEYDGIKYDVCTCSYIDKVKYTFDINDDMTDKVEETCDTDCEYEKHKFSHKTGYKFKWYEKYEKDYAKKENLSTISNALNTLLIATVSEFDEKAGNKSIIYRARYDPIKFTFNYNNENNYNLKLEKKISKQTIYYDEDAWLKDNINVRGYVFKGWTFEKGGSKIELNKLQDVKNYTAEDLKEYDIYPVYNRMDYTLVYNSGNYYFHDGSKEQVVSYNFFDEGSLIFPNITSKDIEYVGYADGDGNRYQNLSDVQKVIEKMGKAGVTLYLTLVTRGVAVGSPEHPKPGDPGGGNVTKPTAGTKSLWDETTAYVGTTTISTSETLDNTIDSSFVNETIKTYGKISGMSDTNIVEEETGKNELDNDGRIIATLSVANMWNNNNNKVDKLQLLLMFIRANRVGFIFMSLLLLILIIIYEILIIRYMSKTNHREPVL